MKNWKSILAELVTVPSLHGRFLNTLSLMEYIGSRKIVKSQQESDIDAEVLSHIAEEVRHAQMFKKAALKVSYGQLESYSDEHLLAGDQGRAYLQVVDRGVEQVLGEGRLQDNYWLSTLLIEERANDVYPYYEELLRPLGMGGFLKTILREEENHLKEVRDHLLGKNLLTSEEMTQLQKLEEQAFLNIIGAIEISLPSYTESSLATH